MTAFVALLAMDANRQEAGKTDWLSCGTNKTSLKVVSDVLFVLFAFRAALRSQSNEPGSCDCGPTSRCLVLTGQET